MNTAVQPKTVPESAKKPSRVSVCVPSGGIIMPETFVSVAMLISFSSMTMPVAPNFLSYNAASVTGNRNGLVKMALDTGSEYVLFIDADMAFPPDTLVRLLAHGKDIVGATYNKRVPPYSSLGHFAGPPRDLSKGGLIEANLMPGGLLLIKCEVFKQIAKPWFWESYERGVFGVDELIAILRDNYYLAPSADMENRWRKDLEIQAWLTAEQHLLKTRWSTHAMGEDYNFCRKAKAAGFEIWCDLDLTYECKHMGVLPVSTDRPQSPVVSAPVNLGGANA